MGRSLEKSERSTSHPAVSCVGRTRPVAEIGVTRGFEEI